jgi:hypothetical protein
MRIAERSFGVIKNFHVQVLALTHGDFLCTGVIWEKVTDCSIIHGKQQSPYPIV